MAYGIISIGAFIFIDWFWIDDFSFFYSRSWFCDWHEF